MTSNDVQQELAAIFERLDHIERQVDEVEAELRSQPDVTGPLPC